MDEIHSFLSQIPGLAESIGLDKAISFVRLAAQLKDEIVLAQPANYDPNTAPSETPKHVQSFLGCATDMPDNFVSGCWTAFCNTIWTYNKSGSSNGRDPEIGTNTLPACKTMYNSWMSQFKPTTREKDGLRKIILFTLSDGACAMYAAHLHCSLGEHQYIEREVLSLFIGLMLISWTSATNTARVYDTCLSKPENQPNHKDWDPTRSFKLRTEHVWDGFLILLLVEDYVERDEILQVPNTGEQNVRFNDAIRKRNSRICLCGQPEWAHYCNRCMRVWKDGDGLKKLHVLVIDGITIGNPCCGVHDCPEPLINNRHRFCHGHDYRHHICAVEGCEHPVEPQFMTCTITEHRELELNHKKRDKALFPELRGRLQRASVSNPDDAFEAQVTAEEVEEMTIPDPAQENCEAAKDPNGNRKIRALFGRHRTHNEQIFVRPCGMIVAHATFYASESVSQTVDMLQKVFHVDGSMPDIVIYDNNCALYKYLVHQNIQLFDTVGFPVDVFHWKCKHAKDGIECSYHCNPTLFPELLRTDGKAWFFNSSIAEQTNVWLGGYHSMLWEMGSDKYDYFLDEMVMRKNKLTKAKLKGEDALPDYVPNITYNVHA
ncbi:hypothetical protein B0H19DRAFT_1279753 [Mycena capillaripes]|nr:hypothetical protein B0H19DRAFT_1279753 [Mycena capillaripes]